MQEVLPVPGGPWNNKWGIFLFSINFLTKIELKLLCLLTGVHDVNVRDDLTKVFGSILLHERKRLPFHYNCVLLIYFH